jgi:adenylosuccinate synthase
MEATMLTVVVGGQYGSEGKGKIAQYLAVARDATAVVRVGGSNSGHTGFSGDGNLHVLRQLPTAALLPDTVCVLGPGSYIDVVVLMRELAETGLDPERLKIDRNAFTITEEDKQAEQTSGIVASIGSTGSGTGAAVARRVGRARPGLTVRDVSELQPFLTDTTKLLRGMLDTHARVIVEGTQGFGLSVLHSPHYPFATSRDTSAAGAVAEAGLSPRDVDEIALVLRTFPIRVAGDSGPLVGEINWQDVRSESGYEHELSEYTSVTRKLRRVARFDPEIVRRAIAVNQPTLIAMNHIDYVDAECSRLGELTDRAWAFIRDVRAGIGRNVDLVGLGPTAIVELAPRLAHAAS